MTKPAQSLAQQAYEALEGLLVTLALKPGAILTEGELMERLGLGRTPVREAIQRLANEGMLRVRPRRGIEVTPILHGDQIALLETRRELERLVAVKAAKRATPDQRKALRAAAARMDQAGAKHDLKRYLAADHACDELLEAASRNPYAMLALGPLRTQCRRLWVALQHAGDLPRLAGLHAELMRAVAEGKESLAARASDAILDELQQLATTALAMD
jgi:DNA-binding GntR family transcriptional regulator